MKNTFFTATTTGILCLSSMFNTASAQEDLPERVPQKKSIKAPRLEVGASLGMMKSMQERRFSLPYQDGAGNLRGNTSGLFVRYYLGKNLAVEAGVNSSFSVGKDLYGPINIGAENYRDILSTSTYSVPLQLQYHLLGSESKIRPYFGVGGGYTKRYYHHNVEVTDNAGSVTRTFGNTRSVSTSFLQFTQGVTWQLNNRWQLNQSINLQREFNNDRTNVDFRVGIGYRLW